MSTKGQSPGAVGTLRPCMPILDMKCLINLLSWISKSRNCFHSHRGERDFISNTNIFKLIIHLRDKGNAPTSVSISEVKRVVIGCLITPLISFLFSSHIKRTTLFYVIYLIKHLDIRRKHSRRIFVSLLGVCHVLCLSCFFFLLQFFFIIIISFISLFH